METKRVLLNKKSIMLFLLIILICIGSYFYIEIKNVSVYDLGITEINNYRNSVINELKGKSVPEMNERIEEQLVYISTICKFLNIDIKKAENYDNYLEYWQNDEKLLRNAYPDIAKYFDENKKNIDISEYQMKEYVLSEISQQITYIGGYPEYLKSIDSKADKISSISVFLEENSQAVQNINKTVKDYKPLKNIKLTIGNDKPITTVLEFDLIHYLIFVFSIFIVFVFLEDNKRGFLGIIRSTPGGRGILTLRRVGILATVTVVTTILLYSVLFFCSFMLYGGIEDLLRPIQSIEIFQNFVFPINEIQFIGLYIIINCLTKLTLVFMFWFVFSLVQNKNIALIIVGIIFTVEYTLYKVIPVQSNIAILKCLNVFYYINPTEAIVQYYNLNSFIFLINLFWLIITSALFFLLFFVISCVAIGISKYPVKNFGRIENFLLKIFETIKNLYWTIVERLTITGIEFYKTIIVQRGWIVLLVFFLLLYGSINTVELQYSATDGIVNEFYENCSGNVTEDTLDFISRMEQDIEIVDKDFSDAVVQYTRKEITEDEYIRQLYKWEAYESKREAVQIIKERVKYAQENGVWLLNPRGYEKLLGSEGFSRQRNFSLLSIFCIIVIMSSVFSYEKKSMMNVLLATTYKGRSYLFYKKIVSVTILTVIIWLSVSVTELMDIVSTYSLSTLDASIKSLEFFSCIPFECSIGVFLVLLYGTRLLLLISVAYIVCLISIKVKPEFSIALSFIILIVPSFLFAIGIETLSCVAVIIPISAMELIFKSEDFMFIIPMIIVILLGIFSIIMAKKNWCRESKFKCS